MGYYKEKTTEHFKSSIDTQNRINDSIRVYDKLKLEEEGNSNTLFYSKNGNPLAKGYLRIVYGDHGPYIEFLPEHMIRSAWETVRKGIGYYDICKPKDGSKCKLYVQRKTVKNLPNPPKGKYSVNHNRINEGYADYRIGRLYISPDDIMLI